MAEFTLAEAAAATGGRIAGDPATRLLGASLDSRHVPAGGLFVALAGERTDGHDHAAAAFERGAAAALVSREIPVPPGRSLLVVDDVPKALLALAAAVRRREGWKVVAVTGSAGKTTTKEMTATVLGGSLRAAASPGNRNNTLGLPEAVLSATPGLEVFVAECGMSFPGELTALAAMLGPDVVITTLIAPAHLANFASVDDIERAKEELIRGAGPSATLVYNADDPRCAAIASRHPGKSLGVSVGGDTDLSAVDLAPTAGGMTFTLRVGGATYPVAMPMSGAHNVRNFLAAAGAATALGLSPEVIAARGPAVRPAPHRGERHLLPSGATLVDECYNSSPEALVASAEGFGASPVAGRRVGLLGEMRELGAASADLHRETGRRIARHFDEIVAVGGGDARALLEGAREGGLDPKATRLLPTPESAAAEVAGRLAAGDAVLLKGSRGVALERALPGLGVGNPTAVTRGA